MKAAPIIFGWEKSLVLFKRAEMWNLINSKYSISPLKAFIHRVATIHKICSSLLNPIQLNWRIAEQ